MKDEIAPRLVCIAGPNGAGKSTFFETRLARAGLLFVNADRLARELSLDARTAAAVADQLRRELVAQRESFIFETVFSDPMGDKVDFLVAAAESGYAVSLIFIGLESAKTSEARVAMRVLQGEHDVPTAKLVERYPRTLRNLKRAIERLPYLLIYDNSDLASPYRKVAEYESGKAIFLATPIPRWLPLQRRRRSRRGS